MASKLPADVQNYLDDFPSLVYDNEKQRIRCRFTNHEMSATANAIDTYVKGKRFKKAAENKAYNYEQYKQHLVPSNKKKHLHELFCNLTLRHIGNAPQDVERHVKGKRFQKAKNKWDECKQKGVKFFPRTGGRQKKDPSSDIDSDSAGGGEDLLEGEGASGDADDDFSDLYPDEFFKGNDAVDDSEEEEEEEEDDDDEENVKEGVVEEPVKSSNAKTKPKKKTLSKKQKLKMASQQKPRVTVEDDSGSDYDIGVLEASAQTPDSDAGASSGEESPPTSSDTASENSKNKKRTHSKKLTNSLADPPQKKIKINK